MAAEQEVVMSNRRVILKRYVTGFPTEDDMELITGTARLAPVPPAAAAAVVVKNLYLSCDPYVLNRMSNHNDPNDFVPGEVLETFGVSKVVESGHPGFKFGSKSFVKLAFHRLPQFRVKIFEVG